MQTHAEFQRRHVLLQADVELELPEVNSGCPQCAGVDSSSCHLCRGRAA
jgi:hypothetical protein